MHFGDLDVGPAPQLPLATYTRRRARLAKKLGEGHVLVIATHPRHQYSHDVDHVFRPHSDFWYLTGFGEPEATLLLHGGTGRTELFVQSRKKEAEIWTGRRLGVERTVDALGVDAAFPAEELQSRLGKLVGREKVHCSADYNPAVKRKILRAAGRRLVPDQLEKRPGGPEARRKTFRYIPHGRRLLHEMRLVKEAEELKMLQKACDLGVAAHKEAAARVKPGAHEYEVEAAFAHHARSHGSTGVGYPSICGCGPNAATLHYISNRDRLTKGKAFLIDAGCEWGWYTSDITRTYPVGDFTKLQSSLYDLVHAAHQAALKEVRPGVHFKKPHEKAVEVLTMGLIDHGYLEERYEVALKEQTYRRYFMHGTSHFLGLDVHDAGSYTGPDGKPRKLVEDMVLTVEPGLYFNPDFAPCPDEAVGIGIRIEDDVVVSSGGARNLTRKLAVDQSELAGLVG